jgi:hypothetical protein
VRRGAGNHPARVDRVAQGAEAIGVALSGRADAALLMTPGDRDAALLVYAMLADCAHSKGEWLRALTTVVGIASPVLEPQAVQPLFERVGASACARSLDPAQRAWLSWLAAINARDPGRILEAAGALLPAIPAGLEAERGRVLTTGMASALALRQPADAARLRDAYFRELPAAARGDIALRVVLAHVDEIAPPAKR